MQALPRVNCFTSFKNGFSNYINFKGRIRRSEYWWFMFLSNIITAVILLFFLLYVFGIILTLKRDIYNFDRYGNPLYNDYYDIDYDAIYACFISLLFYMCFLFLPVLSATVRRLHDVGKPGELALIIIVPLFGFIALLVVLCTDSNKGANEFGPSTKYVQIEDNLNEGLVVNDNDSSMQSNIQMQYSEYMKQ